MQKGKKEQAGFLKRKQVEKRWFTNTNVLDDQDVGEGVVGVDFRFDGSAMTSLYHAAKSQRITTCYKLQDMVFHPYKSKKTYNLTLYFVEGFRIRNLYILEL